MLGENQYFSLAQRLIRQRTMTTARSAVASCFGTATDWFFDQDEQGAVLAAGPHGLFRDGLQFPASVADEQARTIVADAQRWILEQQNSPPAM